MNQSSCVSFEYKKHPKGCQSEGQYGPRQGYEPFHDFMNSHSTATNKTPLIMTVHVGTVFMVQFELIVEMNGLDMFLIFNELAACLQGLAVALFSDLQPSERQREL